MRLWVVPSKAVCGRHPVYVGRGAVRGESRGHRKLVLYLERGWMRH